MGRGLGTALRNLRKSKGLTQQEVADLLGVKKATISHYETGRNEPDLAMLRRLAEIYDIDRPTMLTFILLNRPLSDIILDAKEETENTEADAHPHRLIHAALTPYLGKHFEREFLKLPERDRNDFLDDIRLLWEIRYLKRCKSTTD